MFLSQDWERPETILAGLMRLKWFSATANVIVTYLCLYHLTLLFLLRYWNARFATNPRGKKWAHFSSVPAMIHPLPSFISSTVLLLLSPFLQKGHCRAKGSWSFFISLPQHGGGDFFLQVLLTAPLMAKQDKYLFRQFKVKTYCKYTTCVWVNFWISLYLVLLTFRLWSSRTKKKPWEFLHRCYPLII